MGAMRKRGKRRKGHSRGVVASGTTTTRDEREDTVIEVKRDSWPFMGYGIVTMKLALHWTDASGDRQWLRWSLYRVEELCRNTAAVLVVFCVDVDDGTAWSSPRESPRLFCDCCCYALTVVHSLYRNRREARKKCGLYIDPHHSSGEWLIGRGWWFTTWRTDQAVQLSESVKRCNTRKILAWSLGYLDSTQNTRDTHNIRVIPEIFA